MRQPRPLSGAWRMGSCWEEIGCLGAPLTGRKLSHSLPSFSPVAGQDLEEGRPGSRCKFWEQAEESRC